MWSSSIQALASRMLEDKKWCLWPCLKGSGHGLSDWVLTALTLIHVRGGRVANARASVACNAGGDGFTPNLAPSVVFHRFTSRIDAICGTEGLEMVCVVLQGYCDL